MKRVRSYWCDRNVLTPDDGDDSKLGKFKFKTGEFYDM